MQDWTVDFSPFARWPAQYEGGMERSRQNHLRDLEKQSGGVTDYNQLVSMAAQAGALGQIVPYAQLAQHQQQIAQSGRHIQKVEGGAFQPEQLVVVDVGGRKPVATPINTGGAAGGNTLGLPQNYALPPGFGGTPASGVMPAPTGPAPAVGAPGGSPAVPPEPPPAPPVPPTIAPLAAPA